MSTERELANARRDYDQQIKEADEGIDREVGEIKGILRAASNINVHLLAAAAVVMVIFVVCLIVSMRAFFRGMVP